MEWSNGLWSNDNILQLIELYKEEPCLWDPRTKNYKNRCAHAAAWQRILSGLPFKTTLDEAKKKKNSLMGYYRIHLNRYKKTLSVTGGKSMYQTTWFAFELMHSFLSPIYGPEKKTRTLSASPTGDIEIEIKSEPRSDSEDENPEGLYIEEFSLKINEDPPAVKSKNEEVVVADKVEASIVKGNEEESLPKVKSVRNERRSMSNKQPTETDETAQNYNKKNSECDCTKKELKRRERRDSMDEFDLFGCMLAAKIRKVNSTPEREILMNSIQNMVFETIMKCHKKKSE